MLSMADKLLEAGLITADDVRRLNRWRTIEKEKERKHREKEKERKHREREKKHETNEDERSDHGTE